MPSPQSVRRILLIVVIAIAGFGIGFTIVHYYKQANLQPVQLEPAPVLPAQS